MDDDEINNGEYRELFWRTLMCDTQNRCFHWHLLSKKTCYILMKFCVNLKNNRYCDTRFLYRDAYRGIFCIAIIDASVNRYTPSVHVGLHAYEKYFRYYKLKWLFKNNLILFNKGELIWCRNYDITYIKASWDLSKQMLLWDVGGPCATYSHIVPSVSICTTSVLKWIIIIPCMIFTDDDN